MSRADEEFPIEQRELARLYVNLADAVRAYLAEVDCPAPDYVHRRTLRDGLRELVGEMRDELVHEGKTPTSDPNAG